MNNFIKQVIEEKFASVSQQKLFFAKSKDKSLSKKERKKWEKMAHEFAKKTDFKKLPKKVKKDVDEIVDELGNIKMGSIPNNLQTKGVTQNDTSDEVVKTSAGSMGTHGVHGTHTSLRYWAEGKELSKNDILEIALEKNLGAEETVMKDMTFDQAKKYFKDLGLDDDEIKNKMSQLGYDKELDDDQIRLVEKKQNSLEDFIESVITKKSKDNEFVKKQTEEKKELNSLIKRQINSLKETLKSNGLSSEDIMEYLRDNE